MTGETLRILTVMIGEQHFGLDVSRINAIMSRQESTDIPQAGERVAGLINVRGHIVMLVNVKACLGMSGADCARMNVTVEHGGEIYGLLFEAVGDIVELDSDLMEPVPTILEERWQGMASGIFRRPKTLLIMLDIDKLIAIAQPEAQLR
jgi:purine-binding chemotaxis protein CheW